MCNSSSKNERTKVLVWYFCYLLVSKSSCLVEASAGAGGRGSSFFGILGNAICGSDANDSNRERCDFSRSLPYVRLGHWSLSKGRSSNNDLALDGWATTKSRSGEISIGSKPMASASSSDRRAEQSDYRIERPKEMSTVRHRTSNSQTSRVAFRRGRRRGVGRRVHSDEGSSVTTCLPVSVSALSPTQDTDLTALTSPIVPLSLDINVQNGDEFSDPKALDLLVASGLELAATGENDTSEWIEWKTHSATRKLLEGNNHNDLALLEQGEVLVYVGKAKKDGHGSNLPIIKTRSLLPMSAEEMADLLMDSSKVKIYNKMSVGRTDLRNLGEGTKVVCNLTKPPIAKSNMLSCTLMHSRRLVAEGGEAPSYVVVSRALPGMVEDHQKDLPRNDILLGFNLLEDRGPNECLMTAVTHVYSPALPTMLAKKMGVSSAVNFVKDVRNSCIGVGS